MAICQSLLTLHLCNILLVNQEFERQNLHGYRVTKEGDYYFLIVDKALAHQLRYSQQLKSACSSLTQAQQEGVVEDDTLISKEERSFSLPCIFTKNPLEVTSKEIFKKTNIA